MESLTTDCVIAGGGPAGMMCALLLARAGIDVIVLEKHADFLRDFRGDTIHPSTLELMHELGVVDKFLARPHTEVRDLTVEIGKESFKVGDFTHLPTHCKFLALMPQWDFLDFILGEAEHYDTFRLKMQAEVTDLLTKRGRIAGVLAKTPDGLVEIRAKLVIGADGRGSVVRARANMKVRDFGAPFDVLWMRLPYAEGDPKEPVARFQGGDFFIMLYRGDYWQCAFVIPKGGFTTMKAEGLTGFRARLRSVAGFARERVETIQSFDDVKLLTVKVDRLTRWARRGLVCIGDAAHAMSPVGGVGINLAIQDAVATANILAPVLKKRVPRLSDLDKIQRRRLFPTRVIQRFQVIVQNRVLAPNMRARQTPKPPFILRLMDRFPWLRRIPARFLGLGVRPEHVRTENVAARTQPPLHPSTGSG
jgi:2-polyprenyl-6-methoxyphenol hydroxylase-like FAD-dependent oxidoreductase